MKLIFERSRGGRKGVSLPKLDVPNKENVLPDEFLREELRLPEVSELDVVRHFTGLSTKNFGVDTGFYPLGSCTMKYNPKVNEDLARLPGFALLHQYAPEELTQGALQLMYELERYLEEIAGMDGFTLQPAAGAHGELLGAMIMKAYFKESGENRTKIIVPDSAHGTNPASCTSAGFEVLEVKSDSKGGVDLGELRSLLNSDVAGIMLTNPNTLGLFDENILEIAKMMHDNGSLLYYDGANLNAVVGVARPGDMGFDIVHLNLHKTFSVPHGGGGPGSGPVGVKQHLIKFLPMPRVEKDGDRYHLNYDSPNSIGKIRAFYGNFLALVRAYAYIRSLGKEGIPKVAQYAVLNANYMMQKLKHHFNLPYDRACMHEFVLNDVGMPNGVTTLDIAKRLLDYGMHAPSVYFPLIVHGAMMIEPTETESKQALDEFIDAMVKIRSEAAENPEIVKTAPHNLPVSRLDGVLAARSLNLGWRRELAT